MKLDALRILAFLFVLTLSTIVQAVGYAYLGEEGTLYLAQPIKDSEWKRLKELPIKHVYLYGGADAAIFKDKNDLPKLKRVTLDLEDPSRGNSSPENNPDPCYFTQQAKGPLVSADSYIADLSANYPKIQFLTVEQDGTLSEKSFNFIGSLSDLQYLEILCPLQSKELFKGFQFTKVRYLRTNQQFSNANFQNLEELCLERVDLSTDFLASLHAPSLKNLRMYHCNLSPKSLDSLVRFPKLKFVDLSTSNSVKFSKKFENLIREQHVKMLTR